MDKKIIALAVASVLATPLALANTATADSSTTQKVKNNQDSVVSGNTVYADNDASLKIGGRAEARLSIQDGNSEDKTRIRLNMLGKVDIEQGLYGVGFYELEYQANDNSKTKDSDEFDTRKAYAGMGGTFGEVTYGKNDGALGVLTDFTDIMAYHGAAASYKVASADRTDNMMTYKGSFDDLAIKASYRFADRIETDAGEYDNNEKSGYSLSAIYTVADTGLALGLGGAKEDSADDKDYDNLIATVSYEIGGLYLSFLYEDATKADDDLTAYEVAAAYTMDQFVLSSTYGNQELDDDTSADSLAIDMTYYFKKNFRTYVSYNFNLMDEDDAGSDAAAEDELAVGLRYDF